MPNYATRRPTCRYFAFGPNCPNEPQCLFAHYDAGQFAEIAAQPGTCLSYSQRVPCHRGSYCPYEHRYTGVTGFGQGTIELVGFELQVANAAYQAGFNTTNHPGLFNLIWAVKRQTLRTLPPPRRRPWIPKPPHPIYPDRYRPSSIGDNTTKKRKRIDEVTLRFRPVPSLMQKGGSKDNPIKIDSDDEDKKEQSSGMERGRKKLKSNQGIGVTPSQTNPIVDEIVRVKGKLDTIRVEVDKCQADMKILFDKNTEAFDPEDIMKLLGELADAMNKAYDGAQDAGKVAEKTAARMTFGGPVF